MNKLFFRAFRKFLRRGLANQMPKRGRHAGGTSFSRNGADSGTRGNRSNGWLDFEDSPIGVGTGRLAYRCRVQDGCYRGYTEGSYLIFKVFKPAGVYRHVQDVDSRDVQMQVRARELAESFNHDCEPNKHARRA